MFRVERVFLSFTDPFVATPRSRCTCIACLLRCLTCLACLARLACTRGWPGRPGWPGPQAGQAGQAGQGRPKAAGQFRAQVHAHKTMADLCPNGFIWIPFCPALDQTICEPRYLHLAHFCLCQMDVLRRGSNVSHTLSLDTCRSKCSRSLKPLYS